MLIKNTQPKTPKAKKALSDFVVFDEVFKICFPPQSSTRLNEQFGTYFFHFFLGAFFRFFFVIFEKAIGSALSITSEKETLIVVTADHSHV